MRNGFRVTALGAGFLLAGLGMAQAGTIELDRDNNGADAYQGRFGGGEYLVHGYTSDGSPGDASCFPPAAFGGYDAGGELAGANPRASIFQTFCLEINENLDFQNPMDWECNTEAVLGGIGGGSPDPLSAETAYLYSRFYRGILSNYEYDVLGADDADNTVYNETRGESATALQLAIWYLEDELVAGAPAHIIAAYGANAQAQAWVAEAQALNDGTIGRVRVLNLSQAQTNRQDVLVLTAIPLPPAAFLGLGLMSAIGGMEFFRRRRRQLS
jgi:hypothetical protein